MNDETKKPKKKKPLYRPTKTELETLKTELSRLVKESDSMHAAVRDEYNRNLIAFRNKESGSASHALGKGTPECPTPLLRPRISQRAAGVSAALRSQATVFTFQPVGESTHHIPIERTVQTFLDMANFNQYADKVILDGLLGASSIIRVSWYESDQSVPTARTIGNYCGLMFDPIDVNNFICYPANSLELDTQVLVGDAFDMVAGDLKEIIRGEGWLIKAEEVDKLPEMPKTKGDSATPVSLVQNQETITNLPTAIVGDAGIVSLYNFRYRGKLGGEMQVLRVITDAAFRPLYVGTDYMSYVAITADRTIEDTKTSGAAATPIRKIESFTNYAVNRSFRGQLMAMFPPILVQGMTTSHVQQAYEPGTMIPMKSIGTIKEVNSAYNGAYAEQTRMTAHQYADAAAITPDSLTGAPSSGVRTATENNLKAEGFKMASTDQISMIGDGLVRIGKSVLTLVEENYSAWSGIYSAIAVAEEDLAEPMVIGLASTSTGMAPEQRTQEALTMLQMAKEIPGADQIVKPLEILYAVISEMRSPFAADISKKLEEMLYSEKTREDNIAQLGDVAATMESMLGITDGNETEGVNSGGLESVPTMPGMASGPAGGARVPGDSPPGDVQPPVY